MEFSFAQAIADLGANAAFTVANQATPPSDYLFAQLLPEMNKFDYIVKSGTMTVRATMAGLTGMDSPYPPGGVVELSKFLQESAKIANHVPLTENAIRELQQMLREMLINGQPTNDFVQMQVLNFLQKVIVQAHLDRFEWLRGQALVNGSIDWTFNQINLLVDYAIPSANILPQRTSTDAWDSTASKFWTDIRLLQAALRYNVRAFIIHPDTLLATLDNDVNKIEITAQDILSNGVTRTRIRRLVGDNERVSSDSRDTVELIAYGKEGEIPDTSNPGRTTNIKFMPTKKILAVGRNQRGGYVVGEGSTPDPLQDQALGYTHIAPTVEGGGTPGRWAQLYTPENLPMQLHGRGVTNGLPVIEVPDKIAIASSQIGGS